MRYHHSRPLRFVEYDVVYGLSDMEDALFLLQYKWLETKLGFPPVFLAVGDHMDTLTSTGYFRHEDPRVLYSFEHADGTYMDRERWNQMATEHPNEWELHERTLFRPNWNPDHWLRKAYSDPQSVQLAVRELDLREAGRIWVPTYFAKWYVEQRGFSNVIVKRHLSHED